MQECKLQMTARTPAKATLLTELILRSIWYWASLELERVDSRSEGNRRLMCERQRAVALQDERIGTYDDKSREQKGRYLKVLKIISIDNSVICLQPCNVGI